MNYCKLKLNIKNKCNSCYYMACGQLNFEK